MSPWTSPLTSLQISSSTKVRLIELIKQLNHRAKIIEAKYSQVDVKEIVNTGMFSLEVAQSGYGWLQDLHAMTVREVCQKTKEYRFEYVVLLTHGVGQWKKCHHTQAGD